MVVNWYQNHLDVLHSHPALRSNGFKTDEFNFEEILETGPVPVNDRPLAKYQFRRNIPQFQTEANEYILRFDFRYALDSSLFHHFQTQRKAKQFLQRYRDNSGFQLIAQSTILDTVAQAIGDSSMKHIFETPHRRILIGRLEVTSENARQVRPVFVFPYKSEDSATFVAHFERNHSRFHIPGDFRKWKPVNSRTYEKHTGRQVYPFLGQKIQRLAF